MENDAENGGRIPKVIYTKCRECCETTKHNVLNGRIVIKKDSVKLIATLQCTSCGSIYNGEFTQERDIEVNTIVSWADQSEKTKIRLMPDADIKIDDIVYDNKGIPLKVRGIESNGRRVEKAKAREIDTLWTVRFDKVRVKVSISQGATTSSKTIVVPPDEYFTVGEEIEIDGIPLAISKIKTRERMLYVGKGAEAMDIVRIYARRIKNY